MNQTEDLFNISDGISGSPTSYIAHASNLVSGISFNSSVSLSSCEEDNDCLVELPSFYCPQSTVINVTISAANKLGEGPPSSPFMIECINNFVRAEYMQTTSESTISCIFLNPSDTSEKTCCVTHGECDKNRPENVQECKTDPPYSIQLEVSGPSSQRYCYTVTASNDTYIVKVEGIFTLGDNDGGSISVNTAAIAAGVIVPIISILLLLGTGIIVGVGIKVKSKRRQPQCYKTTDVPSLKQYLVPYHLPSTLKTHKVTRDYELREYVTKILNVDSGFRRGHTYYEFTNEVENILEGKEVLLQDRKKTNKWFQLDQAKVLADGRLKLYGEGITRSSFEEHYRVFIQSFGSGARHLPHGSSFLYNHSEDQVEPDILQKVPVCSEHFAHEVIDSEDGLTVQQFCTQNRLQPRALNIFLTAEHLPEGMRDQRPRDVILMNRESRELFTGPFAHQMLDPKNEGDLQKENDKWKVFALLETNKQDLVFKKGSEVLYQDSMYRHGSYTVLDVDQDHMRMSKFVEAKLKCQYEDQKAFYEAIEIEEDLLYCKKILRPRKEELSREELKLQSLVEYFYAIPGVPSKAVKPEQLRLDHHKIFIQSTSQGSRCLKKGEKLLYLKEYIKWNPIDAQTGPADHPDD